MVVAAAARDRVFFKQSQSRCCFSRIQDLRFGSTYLLHISGRQCCDSREPLDEVQSHSFGGENRPRTSGHLEQNIAALEWLTIFGVLSYLQISRNGQKHYFGY